MVIFENIILVYIDKAILDKATDSWMYVLMLDQQILCLAVYKLGLAKLVLPNNVCSACPQTNTLQWSVQIRGEYFSKNEYFCTTPKMALHKKAGMQ